MIKYMFYNGTAKYDNKMGGGFNMRKKIFIVFLCVLIIVGIVFSYSRTYKISDNKNQLEYTIKQFINRPTVIYKNIDIKQELNINNKKYILLLIDNLLGDAELTKGINNKYKIESAGTVQSFSQEIYKTNTDKYLIVKGKNPDMKISYLKITLNNKEYKVIIPHQEYYIAYCELPIKTVGTQLVYPDINTMKLYNKNDVDITNEMTKILFQ
ncbi:hypothetical protein [Clostridium estertheticum]|uniref:hypothetical protein n=1 Tax=Clostridium estertheticum TaxID=238834 RepID=UPI001C7CF998|nr:hypothetical protein [Clostridium estertheticum]MBX4272042.1 hypothetical protein [Clostridium estertheticum]WLC82339.1 hypothetical protein KTC98_23785 [Clostridium estertheticum]